MNAGYFSLHLILEMLSTLLPLVLHAVLVKGYVASDGTVVIPGASSYNGLNLVPQMGWDKSVITLSTQSTSY